ncbi:organic cation/carnitine transporter 7 [Selaginella moellendorffii]|uniref:organic cation/carnitine transporter 7 n=1 Tax=Selaginella moellendorffii TaxID=88036 RepID=UPI000D1C8836|nr:organic cation/carnitine transporter 7 [Selaginella moellendorffii]|eukprot:XP_024535954.1 organic cation/carnitine transporter 7 [Selaginella moellendorffii]
MEEERVFTLDDAIESLGFGRFQCLILVYAGMSWMAEAMEMMLLSFVGPAVEQLWDLSPRQESAISSVVFAGMMIGAYSWGVLSDSKGRRIGFFATAVITFIAGFLSSFAPNYYALLFLRALVGIGLGGGPVVSSWFMEFVPAPNRGTLMVIFSVFWTLGSILEAILAWTIMPRLGWRWLLGVSSTPLLFLLIFYPLVPESPRYYAAKGDTASALAILKKMAAANKLELPQGRFVCSGDKHDEEGVELEATQLLCEKTPTPGSNAVIAAKDPPIQFFSKFAVLFSPPLLRSTILLWLVFFANAFTYYGLVLLASQLSSQQTRCKLASPARKNSPLLHSGDSKDPVFRDVLITSCAELPGLMIAAAMVDYYGRKVSMAVLFIFCGLFLSPLVSPQPEGVTTFLLFGARACIMGSFTILYVYAPEVYPTSSRTTGLGTANSFARIGGILCPLVAVALVRTCHHSLAIMLFTLVSAMAAALIFSFPIETKGRALTDVV